MKLSSRLSLLLSLAALASLSGAASASAWAPAASATIHPGVMTFTGGSSFLNGAGQCTANFVYTDSSGNVYLGQAAHCSSTGCEHRNERLHDANRWRSGRRSTPVNSSTAGSRTAP